MFSIYKANLLLLNIIIAGNTDKRLETL